MERFEDDQDGTGVVTERKSKVKPKRPRLYKVLLHNDNYTTREFVVQVLKEIFHKNENDAIAIMMHVHNRGVGIAGVFTRDIAETKVSQVHTAAERYEFPLRLSMEPEDTDKDSTD